MEASRGILWSDTISHLYHTAPGSALEERLHFGRLVLLPAALVNWPGLLGIPGLTQLLVVAAALAVCHLRLRESDLDRMTKLGVRIAVYVALTLLTNLAMVAWLSRSAT
jgi:hypothetical protein